MLDLGAVNVNPTVVIFGLRRSGTNYFSRMVLGNTVDALVPNLDLAPSRNQLDERTPTLFGQLGSKHSLSDKPTEKKLVQKNLNIVVFREFAHWMRSRYFYRLGLQKSTPSIGQSLDALAAFNGEFGDFVDGAIEHKEDLVFVSYERSLSAAYVRSVLFDNRVRLSKQPFMLQREARPGGGLGGKFSNKNRYLETELKRRIEIFSKQNQERTQSLEALLL